MSITLSVFIPVITALVEVIKKACNLNSKYIPLVSIVFGIIVSFLANGQNILGIEVEQTAIPITILVGIMIGLMSCGLYSGIISVTYVAKQISDKIIK